MTASRSRDRRRNWFVALFLLPALAFLFLFLYYPIEETFRLSLMKSTGLGAEDVFIGLDNYVKLFTNDEFQAGLAHVFGWAFWSVVIQLPFSFAIAFSLTFYKNKLTGPLKAVYYLANILPSAITALLGKFIFASNNGIITSLAHLMGLEGLANVDWFGDPNLAFWTVFIVATWTYTGFPIVFLMARIEQIAPEIREAAELDGVTGWSYAWKIVLPLMTYPLQILGVLATVGSLKLFDLPYMLTTGGPGYSTMTLGITLYRKGFIDWQYGKAAAIGVVILVLCLIFTVAQFAFQKKEGEE
ncbi:MAG TPA: sugar ABC transporter permease [Spirochaetia bacterium]|jgi:raffinose/stachyose/melibiose transport system permease protein|nr:sugar ABC transporter permease [Spirochaetia bacterium]